MYNCNRITSELTFNGFDKTGKSEFFRFGKDFADSRFRVWSNNIMNAWTVTRVTVADDYNIGFFPTKLEAVEWMNMKA